MAASRLWTVSSPPHRVAAVTPPLPLLIIGVESILASVNTHAPQHSHLYAAERYLNLFIPEQTAETALSAFDTVH